MQKIIFAFLLTTFIIAAEKKPVKKALSLRPQLKTHFLAIIQLESPAFLAVDKEERTEGLKQKILDEQKAWEEKLMALSPEIKVLHRYRFVLNALSIIAPNTVLDKVYEISGTSYIEGVQPFYRPEVKNISRGKEEINFTESNSVKFIGAEKAQKELTFSLNGENKPLNGKGISVGIIDTGIDYTHKMLGGNGSADTFKELDPNTENNFYPNKKVVGGYDFVGTDYNSGSADFKRHIPKPDSNPIDEGGHGTHVGGTVAGIGDGVNTYSGVAPEADLYALKVFGKDGSTGDSVIIAALEFAADPNQDMNPNDRLDVVNLSLGSSYGKPYLLYKQAMRNLINGGTLVAASAGNSGHFSYIVGAPGTVEDVISVAASIDNMPHNWQFDTVKFSFKNGDDALAEAFESSMTKELADIEALTGNLVYAGVADKDFDEELSAALKGKIALIDRGKVTFADKIKRAAAAGALGVVVANNVPGDPFTMGGDGEFDIPAVMITQALGDTIKTSLNTGEVSVDFKSPDKVKRPELIDTLTGFSSKGPRSQDGLLKPEISAPGNNIISADMGTGDKGVQFSGTSMAAPHIAGALALMRQRHPLASNEEVKSMLMGSSKQIINAESAIYPLAMQGAGRVQVFESLNTSIVSMPASVSLGIHQLAKSKKIWKKISLKNRSDEAVKLSLNFESETMVAEIPAEVTLAPGEQKRINLFFTLKSSKDRESEAAGFVNVKNGERMALRVPIMAVVTQLTRIKSEQLKIFSSSIDEAPGSLVELKLKNDSPISGSAYAFNLIGFDDPKIAMGPLALNRSKNCDLQSAGLRFTERGALQIAVKLYNPVTTWQPCEISVLFDGDNDGVADQELVGTKQGHIAGTPQGEEYSSYLLDAHLARSLRLKYEQAQIAGEEAEQDYLEAVLGSGRMQAFGQSTISIVEIALDKLQTDKFGKFSLKLAVLNEDPAAVEVDDFLSLENKWLSLSANELDYGFTHIEESYAVEGNKPAEFKLQKGRGSNPLIMYYPANAQTRTLGAKDKAAQVLRGSFSFQ